MKHLTMPILGYTSKGTPIFHLRGADDPTPQQQPGSTITIDGSQAPQQQAGEHRGEEPPAHPASTASVDPDAAFARGFREQQAAGQQPTPGATQNPATGRTFTEAEVEAIRQQEKDKLYGRIDELGTEIRTMREEREAEKRARDEEEARKIEEARKASEGEMDVRELIGQKEQEWNERFNKIQEEARLAQAALDQERRLGALKEFRDGLIAQHADDIMPHLVPYVGGNTEEEIKASVQQQIETTGKIMADLAAAQQAQQAAVPTTRVTAPGDAGPLEQTTTGQRQYSAEEIAAMNPTEWAKHRDQFLRAAARQGPYGA